MITSVPVRIVSSLCCDGLTATRGPPGGRWQNTIDRPRTTVLLIAIANMKNEADNGATSNMAVDASTPARRSSATSDFVVAGRDHLPWQPGGHHRRAQKMLPSTTASIPSRRLLQCAAGSAAAKPTMPEMRPNFEFASTRSSSVRTTVGTMALFEIAYVFCSTITTNASGNSSSEST